MKASDLIAAGYKQTSRKHRHVACLPEGETAIEALRRIAPRDYYRIMDRLEREAASTYRRMYAQSEGNQIELTREEFEDFRAAGGEASW